MAITEAYESRIISSLAGSKIHYRFCWSIIRPAGTSRFSQAKALGDALAFGTPWNNALLDCHTFHQEFLYAKTRCLLPFGLGASYQYRLPFHTIGTILDLVGTTWECATIRWATTSPFQTTGTWGLRGVVNGGFADGSPTPFLLGVVNAFTAVHLAGLILSSGNLALPAIIHRDGSWSIVEAATLSGRPGRKTAHQEVN